MPSALPRPARPDHRLIGAPKLEEVYDSTSSSDSLWEHQFPSGEARKSAEYDRLMSAAEETEDKDRPDHLMLDMTTREGS